MTLRVILITVHTISFFPSFCFKMCCQRAKRPASSRNANVSDHLAARSRWLHRIVKIKSKENKRYVGTLDLSSTAAQKMWSRSLRTTVFYFGDGENGFYFFFLKTTYGFLFTHWMYACLDTGYAWVTKKRHVISQMQFKTTTFEWNDLDKVNIKKKKIQIVWRKRNERARALAFAINLCFCNDRRYRYPFHPFSLRIQTPLTHPTP